MIPTFFSIPTCPTSFRSYLLETLLLVYISIFSWVLIATLCLFSLSADSLSATLLSIRALLRRSLLIGSPRSGDLRARRWLVAAVTWHKGVRARPAANQQRAYRSRGLGEPMRRARVDRSFAAVLLALETCLSALLSLTPSGWVLYLLSRLTSSYLPPRS